MKTTNFYNGHRWTNDELRILMTMWDEKKEIAEIAETLGSTKNAIAKVIVRLRQEGIPLKRRTKGHIAGRSNKLWTQAEVEYVIRRRRERATVEQIGDELGRTWNAVNALIQKLRNYDVAIPMMGQGVRRLWNPEILKAITIGFMEKSEMDLIEQDKK